MALSKRLRFEIFRRDNHTCRYCGAKAPDVKLTVDHVIPKAIGGTDDPSNLVTACAACNSGKSSIPADSPIVDDVHQDALRWSQAMKVAHETYEEDLAKEASEIRILEDACIARWRQIPPAASATLLRFLQYGFTVPELLYLQSLVPAVVRDPFAYYCGIVWNQYRKRIQVATIIAPFMGDEDTREAQEATV